MGELAERYVVCKYGKGDIKRDFIRGKIEHPEDRAEHDDGFIVFDVGDVVSKQKRWKELLPRVKPYYAVKCRPYKPILKVMNALGVGFDCANKSEIASVLSLGVNPDCIVFSHTRKQVTTLEYADKNNIDLMTFDDEHELRKIKRVFPSARLLLRFAIYDATALYPQGLKFGCKRENVTSLLQLAHRLKLNVVGIHFHIGSESKKPSNYQDAIAYSCELFDVAEKLGFHMTILDIGGGFPGQALSTGKFTDYAMAVSESVDKYFPEGCNVDIIAEPGTYYVKSAVTTVACVIGKRKRTVDHHETDVSHVSNGSPNSISDTNSCFDYYLNEGRYTSFINSIYEPIPTPQPVKDTHNQTCHSGAVYGYTCCETDVIIPKTSLPELEEGDWVFFEDTGNYAHLVTFFNGFQRPFCYYAVPDNCRFLRHIIEDHKVESNNNEETAIGNDMSEDFVLLAS